MVDLLAVLAEFTGLRQPALGEAERLERLAHRTECHHFT
jgi:hypothetical protein